MTKITIDLTKSVDENAGLYFDKSKKAKKKLEGLAEALKDLRAKLEKLKAEKIEVKEIIKKVDRGKKDWYEKFRWFFTSEGLLAVGGRDATSNEIVVKKHAEKNDLVFHTDMAGSPFFVIKATKKIGDKSIKETADATCSFSRAWKMGLSSTSVFYVKPEQVTKEAKAGEFLPKGAFMIKGKTNYADNKINLAVGMKDGKVMAGPVEAVKKHCEKYVELLQGDEKTSAAAKKIKKKIGGELDDIIRALPAGGISVKDIS